MRSEMSISSISWTSWWIPLRIRGTSEFEPQPDLDHARIARCLDLTERWTVQDGDWVAEVHRVEQVEHFDAQLRSTSRRARRHLESLRNRCVDGERSRADQQI